MKNVTNLFKSMSGGAVFQDRDEYGEGGEGVRDLVEMTIKKMDLDRYFNFNLMKI